MNARETTNELSWGCACSLLVSSDPPRSSLPAFTATDTTRDPASSPASYPTSDANTEYTDDATLVWKNTSVIVKRVPSVRPASVGTEQGAAVQKKVVYVPPPQANTMHQPRMPPRRVYPPQGYPGSAAAPGAAADTGAGAEGSDGVDASIAALVSGASQAWETEKATAFAAGGRGRGRGGRGGGRFGEGGGGRGGSGDGPPPPGYICFRCSVPGHWIAQCPTNADPNFDVIRMKTAYGIPQNRLEHVEDGVLVAPTGESSNLLAAEDEFSSMMGFLVDREKQKEGKSEAPAALPAPEETPVAALPATEGEERDAVQRTTANDDAAAPEAVAARLDEDEPIVSADIEDDLDLGPDPADDLGPEPEVDNPSAAPKNTQGGLPFDVVRRVFFPTQLSICDLSAYFYPQQDGSAFNFCTSKFVCPRPNDESFLLLSPLARVLCSRILRADHRPGSPPRYHTIETLHSTVNGATRDADTMRVEPKVEVF